MPQSDSIINTVVDSLPANVQKETGGVIDSLNNTVNYIAPTPFNDTVLLLSILAISGMLVALVVLWDKGYLIRIKNPGKQKNAMFFVISFVLVYMSVQNEVWQLSLGAMIFFAMGVWHLINDPDDEMPPKNNIENYYSDITAPNVLRYQGGELNLSITTIHITLDKHWPYYSMLNTFDKDKFTGRVKEFVDRKIYDIYDDKGFKEMPILISAAAVQLTFGLNDYLLNDFPLINIYPDAFFSTTPFPRFLVGNVSNSCINLSWKHFLKGIECYTDGDNVGLHEMAHALYTHEFIQATHRDNFCKTYEEFQDFGTQIFSAGKSADNHLYCDYAFRNIQEFWAVSIEIFFEQPIEMKNNYGSLYNAICDILNQDPANNITQLRSS